MTVQITIQGGGTPEVNAFISSRADAIIASSAEEMSLLMLKLQAHVVAEHLSGRPGLRQITGKLASSIRAIPTAIEGTRIAGYVEGAGGPAWYGRVHERGAHIPERVPIKARALHWTSPEGFSVFAMRARAFDMPVRAFMKPSLDEMKEEIIAGLNASVVRGLQT